MEKEFDLSEKRFMRACGWNYMEIDVKEFIKIVEHIIIQRKSRRLQLIELGKAAGKDLID